VDHLGKAGFSGRACAGAQLGVQPPHPDMTPRVSHHHVLMLGIAAHAVDRVQPVYCRPNGAHQCWRAAHLPNAHATITFHNIANRNEYRTDVKELAGVGT